MKKFFRKLILILPVFIALSGCAKSSNVNDDNTKAENHIVRKAGKEVQEICGYYYAYDSQIVIDNGEYYGIPCLYYKAKPIDFDNCSKESVRKLRGNFTDDGNFLEPKIFEDGGKVFNS